MMRSAIRPFLPILGTSPWFSALSITFKNMIIADCEIVRLSAAEFLFSRGDEPDGLYAVIAGAVAIGAIDENGDTTTLTVAQAATWFGEIGVVDRRSRTHNAMAIQRSTLLRVPQARLLAFLEKHPETWHELALLLAEKLRLAFTLVEDAASLTVPQRIAARLVMIAEGYGGASLAQNDIMMSQAQLAAMLSTSRQTVNQNLKILEEQSLIMVGKVRITIVDLDGLRRLVIRT